MTTRSFLQRFILCLLVCIFICAMSAGPGMAQSSASTAGNNARPGTFLQKPVPVKTVPQNVPATSAPSDQNAAKSNKQAAQPPSQIKIPPVRITIGGHRIIDGLLLRHIQVSPQDIAKVQKIMELINIGQKSGR